MDQSGSSTSAVRAYLRRERFFVGGYCLLTGLMVGHFVVLAYHVVCSTVCLPDPSTAPAPQAYRLLMPAVEHGLIRLLSIQGAYVLGLVDVLCTALALYCLYSLVIVGFAPNTSLRVAAGGLFLAFVQFPVTFIPHWGRPETTPTALFVALFVYCLTRARKNWMWTALLIAATITQTLVRADVPFILGISLTVLGAMGALGEWGTRTANCLRGAAVTVAAGCTQVYLQFFLYPHRQYQTTSPVMVRLNLSPRYLLVLGLALLPVVFVGVLYLFHRSRLGAVERLAILASLLYLPVWFTVGIVLEVRIFVPMLLLLDVMAARVAVSYLLDEPSGERIDAGVNR